MTSSGRQPQNIKTEISQQPIIWIFLKLYALGSDQNLKLLKMNMTLNGRTHILLGKFIGNP
jgi:hypothetical protein